MSQLTTMVLIAPLALLLASGCGHASREPSSETPRMQPSASVEPTPVTEQPPPPDGAPPRVRFDLASRFDRAELREGSAVFVDLGTPGGAKHTWGGWYSNVGPDLEVDGASAAITTSSRAKLALSTEAGESTLSIRVRAFRNGTARLYVDGRQVASESLAEGEWRVLSAEVELSRGEHEILLRYDRAGRIEGARAYLAVDWMRAGPGGEPAAERPSAGEQDGLPTLTIPDGFSVGYPLEVPADARLRGVAEGEGTLEVWAARDGAEPLRLGVVRGERGPRQVDVDLSPVAGDVARIDLRAQGALRLRHPAIVTLDGVPAPSVRRPRNVLIYLIDTLRADRLRAYDPRTRVETPGISRFAERSTVMASARSQENWTKPSVATLLSGLMPWEHTAFSDGSRVPDSVRLLPQMLKDRGFTTAAFVANGYVSDRFGFQRGWDAWRNYIREGRNTRGENVAADVLRWLDERPAEQPFFLYVHAIDPHVPYRPPATYLRMYDDEPYRGPVDFSRSATLLERIKTGRLRLNERDRRRLEALYDGEVSYQDAHLSSILDGLARRGLEDDTLVVITADHGEEFWDHGSVGHGHNLYDELVHVPLIIRVPGLTPAPRRVDGAVGLVDVPPTILEALGEPIPDDMSGRSLWGALMQGNEEAPTASVAGFMEHWRSVASGRFKIIARPGNRIALYDLANDPGEQQDVSAERPITLAFLRGLLSLRLAETRGDATPTPRARPRPRHQASEATIDPELEAQLEALGYVGSQRRR